MITGNQYNSCKCEEWGDEVKPFKDMTAKEAFKSVYFWSWMEEVHPTLNLIIWAAVLGISGMSLLFSIIALVQ